VTIDKICCKTHTDIQQLKRYYNKDNANGKARDLQDV